MTEGSFSPSLRSGTSARGVSYFERVLDFELLQGYRCIGRIKCVRFLGDNGGERRRSHDYRAVPDLPDYDLHRFLSSRAVGISMSRLAFHGRCGEIIFSDALSRMARSLDNRGDRATERRFPVAGTRTIDDNKAKVVENIT
ncbi:hypothetical protein PUN28_009597 [Cardiocondyla obscurior]|uniref:Uncharacterized protein n=1 Tax=Cardiocondyla obscurior TaxID=286306 RepID=A0AAW2FY28_9HYME